MKLDVDPIHHLSRHRLAKPAHKGLISITNGTITVRVVSPGKIIRVRGQKSVRWMDPKSEISSILVQMVEKRNCFQKENNVSTMFQHVPNGSYFWRKTSHFEQNRAAGAKKNEDIRRFNPGTPLPHPRNTLVFRSQIIKIFGRLRRPEKIRMIISRGDFEKKCRLRRPKK